MLWFAVLAVVAAQSGASPAMAAATPAESCPAIAAALPGAIAGWSHTTRIKAGASQAEAAALSLGAAATATLLPTPEVSYVSRPGRPGGSTTTGGLFSFDAPSAGRYRVALGSAAWIDLVRNGTTMASVGHGRGPECSTIRKMVDFDLQPGRYLLQVAGNGSPSLKLIVARLP